MLRSEFSISCLLYIFPVLFDSLLFELSAALVPCLAYSIVEIIQLVSVVQVLVDGHLLLRVEISLIILICMV